MEESAPKSSHRQMKFYKILFALLILLALGGVGLTHVDPGRSYLYWLSLVPVFAGACLLLEWLGFRGKSLKWTHVLRVQLLLWLSLVIGVLLVYMLLHSGRLNNENTGLVILIMLAMTTFAAGVQLGPLVMLLGCFLGLALVLTAYVKSYVWLIMIGVAVAMAVLFYVFRRRNTG
jgi:hypothetical protein